VAFWPFCFFKKKVNNKQILARCSFWRHRFDNLTTEQRQSQYIININISRRPLFVRQPDIVVGEVRFYRDSIYRSSVSIFFFALSRPSSLNGTQRKSATCSEASAIWKRMSEICGILSPYKSEAPKQPLSTTSQLNGKFNGQNLRNETWYAFNRWSALETTRGLLYRLKMSWTVVHRRLKIGPSFYPPSVNSAFYFIARLRRWGSANGTKPNFAKRWTVNRANNMP